MDQPSLDFTASPAPSRGRTPRARHASFTGAQAQVRTWTAKRSALLQVLQNGNPMTRNELAAVLQWPITSVCSQLDAVLRAGLVEGVDFEEARWTGGRRTRRERFQIRKR